MAAAGLEQKACEKIATFLSRTLANTYLLQVKTQNFHWNLNDNRFASLHSFFEEQYSELFTAVDALAERLRMLGIRSPGSLSEFLDLSTLDEASGGLTGDEMLSELLIDHELIIQDLRGQIKEASEYNDLGTADLLTERLRSHEKSSWMLKAHF